MRFRPEVDYYEILQVHPRASQEMVKKAYRTLMGEMGGHPDLGGDEERAKIINEAYTVLGDPEVRRGYDAARARSGLGVRSTGAARADGGGTGSMGPALQRLEETASKVLLSAAVIAAGVIVARLLRSPTLDLADLLVLVFVLLRIWRQVSSFERT
ncbi:MAG TPA: J domain-containing protein [bacterium]|nr:J domain-containing protein [bacterium]